jgi:type IV pilus assembly protein PilV
MRIPLLRPLSASRGFSLVEVMVALIVIAVGMLGIAKMQGLALSSTGASRSRALAAIEASSLAAAMQANRAYWSLAGAGTLTATVATSGGTATTTSGDATLQTAIGNAGGGSACTGTSVSNLSCLCTTTCLAANLAGADLYDWGQTLAGFLPSATATVTCNRTDTPVDCKILISYLENTVSMTSQQASAAVANGTNGSNVQVNYAVYVIP